MTDRVRALLIRLDSKREEAQRRGKEGTCQCANCRGERFAANLQAATLAWVSDEITRAFQDGGA